MKTRTYRFKTKDGLAPYDRQKERARNERLRKLLNKSKKKT